MNILELNKKIIENYNNKELQREYINLLNKNLKEKSQSLLTDKINKEYSYIHFKEDGKIFLNNKDKKIELSKEEFKNRLKAGEEKSQKLKEERSDNYDK